MRELNQLITNDEYLHSWSELIKLTREIVAVYKELGNSVYGLDIQGDLELESTSNHFSHIFPYVQALVEDNLDMDLDSRIEFANFVAEIIIFIIQISELSEEIYTKYKNDLYFKFGSFIGKWYLDRLEKYLNTIQITI